MSLRFYKGIVLLYIGLFFVGWISLLIGATIAGIQLLSVFAVLVFEIA